MAKAAANSKGIRERLPVCPETLEFLANKGVAVEVLQTEAAVKRFNQLRESVAVGGLFHSTCGLWRPSMAARVPMRYPFVLTRQVHRRADYKPPVKALLGSRGT